MSANIHLPEGRLIEKINLKIIIRHPEAGWPDFSADNQTVLEKTRDNVVLEVRRPVPRAEGLRPAAMTNGLSRYLANALLQSTLSWVMVQSFKAWLLNRSADSSVHK